MPQTQAQVEETALGDPPGEQSDDAMARLFVEHNAALIRFLRLRLDSDQDAKEVAQESYVRLLQLDRPGAVSLLRAFLFRTAANLATDRLRRLRVRRATHADPVFENETDDIDPERAAVARQQLMIVEAGLRELPDKVRQVFLLHRLEGLSVAEAGRRLGVSERTACNYVIKAMLHCRRRMDAVGDEPAEMARK